MAVKSYIWVKLMELLIYERQLWQQGFHLVAGVDEAGRGTLVASVVAAAVILPEGLVIHGIKDSKQLTAKKRGYFYEIIQEQALAIGVARVDRELIEQINIKQAARLAMRLAVKRLKIAPDYLLVDAEKIEYPLPQMNIIKGDAYSQSIAAASIVAKVTRDRLCQQWDLMYPQYGIGKHKGYCTREHREAILKYGPCPLHRRKFLRKILDSSKMVSYCPDLD